MPLNISKSEIEKNLKVSERGLAHANLVLSLLVLSDSEAVMTGLSWTVFRLLRGQGHTVHEVQKKIPTWCPRAWV